MIRDLCLTENSACLHSITPTGGGGKSDFNNEHIDIYERFEFNFNKRLGLATSLYKDIYGTQPKFGSQGIIIYDGKVNNVNRSDAGSIFNDKNGLWETTEGIQYPKLHELKNEVLQAEGYVELNIHSFTICGLFLDLTQISQCCDSIRSFKEFYEMTKHYNLPYFGCTSAGMIYMKRENMRNNDLDRIGEGVIVSLKDIYKSNSNIR